MAGGGRGRSQRRRRRARDGTGGRIRRRKSGGGGVFNCPEECGMLVMEEQYLSDKNKGQRNGGVAAY